MSGKPIIPSVVRAVLLVSLAGCSWFTDFKEQPKIDPWDTPNDSTPPRGNPQGSVPTYGTATPEFMYSRGFPGLAQMSSVVNPVPVSQESVDRGRKAYQINCAVCHGPSGASLQTAPIFKFGIIAPPIGTAGSLSATTFSDGMIFGIIRNGRGLMPSYNRIEEATRWDIVNYMRTLQGKTGLAADTSHGRPGEGGNYLIGATISAPTRPAPFFAPMKPVVPMPTDTTKPPATTPAPGAHQPPTPEALQ